MEMLVILTVAAVVVALSALLVLRRRRPNPVAMPQAPAAPCAGVAGEISMMREGESRLGKSLADVERSLDVVDEEVKNG